LNDKILNGGKLTSEIFTVSSSPEVLYLTSSNNNALGFCGFVETVPETVKLLSVDGVAPTESNILSGKYALVNIYYACFKQESGNEAAHKFADALRSSAVGARFRSSGLVPKNN